MKILKRPAKIKASFGMELRGNSGSGYQQLVELQKLYPIIPATDTDRSWWKNMKTHIFAKRQVTEEGKIIQEKANTMKYCPGIFDFSNCGYIVPCLHDMMFYISKDQKISWDLPGWIPKGWVSLHMQHQIDSCPISDGKNTGAGIIKVITPWYWETPKGWSTIITKPFYNYSNDFDVCPGILDSDLDNMSNHLIHVFLRFNVVDKEIMFRAGQPLCQLIPFERQNTKLTITEEPDEKGKKIIKRGLAIRYSRFPNNPDINGITLLNYRDPSTKKYE